MALPRLRPLDISKMRENEDVYLVLRDREGYAEEVLVLNAVEALIAARLNGRNDAETIARQTAEQTGIAELAAAHVLALVERLDKNYMLQSPRFKKKRRETVSAFRAAPSRPAALAGRSYPAQAADLDRSLGAHFTAPEAPGAPPSAPEAPPLTGLIVPHIDFPRGRVGYAWAYREVFRSGPADLYVILGVAHATPPTPFVLTRKDYDTPFGPAVVDKELAVRLQTAAPYDLSRDELVHRDEHSIEFQAVYLKYAQSKLGGEFKILPLLCSSHDLRGSDPGERTRSVLDALEEVLRGYPGRICLLAGVDFAHIGPCFGDEREAGKEFLGETQAQDRRSIARLIRQDDAGFLDSVMFDGNRRKVCGVSALYAFSRLHKRLHPKARGKLLHYGHAADPSGGEVTFASLSFR